MKNKLLTLAGVLVLLAVLGKFYAGPAIAQTVRAALVQDRDNPARQAFSVTQTVEPMGGAASYGYFPAVPAGKRRLINAVYVSIFGSGSSCSVLVGTATPAAGNTFEVIIPALPVPPDGSLTTGSLTPAQIVLDPGDSGYLKATCGLPIGPLFFTLTGYDIDVP